MRFLMKFPHKWEFHVNVPKAKKSAQSVAYPYPKLKRPSGHVAGRAFLRSYLADLSLFK